jgi:hypothetical protein
MKPYIRVDLRTFEDVRGQLTPLSETELPFEIKRIFWIKNVPIGEGRGNHGHFIGNQFLISMSGSIDVELRVPEMGPITIELNPNQGIWAPPKTWISMKFAGLDSCLLVLADTEYDPNDVYTDSETLQ